MLAPKTNIAFSGSMRKVWLVMLLVLSTATVLVLLVTDQLSRQRATAELDERLSRVAATRTAQLRQNIAALRSDILFLAMVPPVQGIVRAERVGGFDTAENGNNSYAMWQRRLEQIFSAYLTTNPRFLQARLIGVADGGKELVRVDGKSGVVRITPADQLQRKGDRDYFLSTLELAERQVHISDFNLNRERGRVEQPPVRTLRVATPIYTSSGKVFGILVLNVGADTLLPPVAELHQGTPSGLGC